MIENIEQITREKIKNGGVLAMLYFDLHGKEKEVLQKLGASVVNNIINYEGVVYAIGEIDEPINDNNLYSTTIEVKVLTQDFGKLVELVSDFSPFSIEILEPDEINLKLDAAHSLLMKVSSNTYELKKTILTRTLTPKDMERFNKTLKARLKLGEKLLKKGKK